MKNSDTTQEWRIWRAAVQRDEINRALRALYADLDAAVAERDPLCNASGRCCKFDVYGHRLYVTGLEIAWFLGGVRGLGSGVGNKRERRADHSQSPGQKISLELLPPTPHPSNLNPNCPYQIDDLCTAHAIRPLGCRVYFCEVGTEAWQQETTERFLNRLKQLHNDHDLPYSYMEWRAGLAEAGRVVGSI